MWFSFFETVSHVSYAAIKFKFVLKQKVILNLCIPCPLTLESGDIRQCSEKCLVYKVLGTQAMCQGSSLLAELYPLCETCHFQKNQSIYMKYPKL